MPNCPNSTAFIKTIIVPLKIVNNLNDVVTIECCF